MRQGHDTPLRRFLPDADATRGPFGMLGLSPQHCEPDAVLDALRRALERIARHPEARTPDAEEVRLALHVAAAQLLDPDTRAAMIALWSTSADAPPAHVQPPARPATSHSSLDAFRLACFEMIAHSGGWNARARRRVIALADVFGVEPHELHAVFQPAPAPSHTPTPPPLPPATVTSNDPRPRISWGTVALVILNIIAALALTRVIWPTPDEHTPRKAAQRTDDPATKPIATHPESLAPLTPLPPDAGDILASLRELRDQGAATPPPARTDALLSLNDALAATWPDLPERDVGLVVQTFDEIIIDIAATSRPQLDRIRDHWSPHLESARAATHRQAAWSIAAATRLAVTKTLNESTRADFANLLSASGIATPPAQELSPRASLEAGLHYAALSIARRLIADPLTAPDFARSWNAWLQDAQIIARWEPAAYTLLLDTFESLSGLVPGISTSSLIQSAMQRTAAAVDWRHEFAQVRLMAWLSDDDKLPAPALAIATEQIVLQRSDLTNSGDLLASPSATGAARKILRERWAAALEMGVPEQRRRDLERWTSTRRQAEQILQSAQSTTDWMLALVQAARANTAASLIWRQEPTKAAELLRAPNWTPDLSARDQPAFSEFTRPSGERDADWSVRFLNARKDANERLTLLQELRRRDRVRSQTDADVLAEAAFYDPSLQVRQSAQQVARVFAGDPRVVYAALEVLPRTGRSSAESEIVESLTDRRLPPARHPEWHARAAAALLTRLLELNAKSGSTVPDQAAIELARLYDMRLDQDDAPAQDDQPLPPIDNIATSGVELLTAAEPPHAVAERLEQALRREAAIFAPAGELLAHDDLQSARRRLTSNEIERFAVAQLSCFELLAMTTTGERTSRAEAIIAIQNRLADARRTAESLSEQLARTEAAIAEVWAIRLGAEETP